MRLLLRDLLTIEVTRTGSISRTKCPKLMEDYTAGLTGQAQRAPISTSSNALSKVDGRLRLTRMEKTGVKKFKAVYQRTSGQSKHCMILLFTSTRELD